VFCAKQSAPCVFVQKNSPSSGVMCYFLNILECEPHVDQINIEAANCIGNILKFNHAAACHLTFFYCYKLTLPPVKKMPVCIQTGVTFEIVILSSLATQY
jgi:hypothetical protein